MLVRYQYLALTEVGVGAEVGVGVPGVDPHQEATGLPPQVPKIVVDVVKDTHPGSAQPIIRFAKGAKIKGHFKQILQNKKPRGTYQPRGSRREQFEISKGPEQPPSYGPGSDYEFCEDSIHFVFN